MLVRTRAQRIAQGSFTDELRFRHKDGSWRWLLFENFVVTDDAGKPIELHGSSST